MIDDDHVDEFLIRAGERQRAAAPDAALVQGALQQLHDRIGARASDTGDGRRRRWTLAVVIAGVAAAVTLIIVVGNARSDTPRTVPATVPNVASSVATVPTATPPPSSTTTRPSDRPVEPLFPPATNDVVLGASAVAFRGAATDRHRSRARR